MKYFISNIRACLNFQIIFGSIRYQIFLIASIVLCPSLKAHIHVPDNTVFTIAKNTIVHTVEDQSEDTNHKISQEQQRTKIYITEGTLFVNFPSDSQAELVYQEKKANKEKTKKAPIKKTDDEQINEETKSPENEYLVKVELRKQPSPSLLHSDKSPKVGVAPTNFSDKTSFVQGLPKKTSYQQLYFSQNKYRKEVRHIFQLNFSQYFLKEHITRPPPSVFWS